MTRAFDGRPIPNELLEHLVALASRAPSAGKTQGFHLVVLSGPATARFWDVTLPAQRRATFRWQGLLRAPVIAVPLADPQAYVERYSEPDKARSGLGAGGRAWPTPYWTIDASMSVMTMLLAAEDAGLGALFFGVFENEEKLRSSLGIPERLQLLGAIALGWPEARLDPTEPASGQGRSAGRPRRSAAEIIHHDGW